MTDHSDNSPSVPRRPVVEMPEGRRILTDLLIVFVIGTSFLMACPWPVVEPQVQRLLRPALPVLENLGLAHRLRLFAPVPPQWTGRLEFRVTNADGSVENWRYPRDVLAPGDPAGSYNRYLFLYLVWGFDQKLTTLEPAFARYVARQAAAAGSHPVQVDILERVVRIPSPEYGIGRPSPQPNLELPMIRYDVARDQAITTGQPASW
jgi:hypothetical protein